MCVGLLNLLFMIIRYGFELKFKQQPLIRGRGVSYCKNLLSPRFEHSEGKDIMPQISVCLNKFFSLIQGGAFLYRTR